MPCHNLETYCLHVVRIVVCTAVVERFVCTGMRILCGYCRVTYGVFGCLRALFDQCVCASICFSLCVCGFLCAVCVRLCPPASACCACTFCFCVCVCYSAWLCDLCVCARHWVHACLPFTGTNSDVCGARARADACPGFQTRWNGVWVRRPLRLITNGHVFGGIAFVAACFGRFVNKVWGSWLCECAWFLW